MALRAGTIRISFGIAQDEVWKRLAVSDLSVTAFSWPHRFHRSSSKGKVLDMQSEKSREVLLVFDRARPAAIIMLQGMAFPFVLKREWKMFQRNLINFDAVHGSEYRQVIPRMILLRLIMTFRPIFGGTHCGVNTLGPGDGE